jgi:hypothetical protein
LIFSIVIPAAAQAQDLRAEVRAACQADVKANCGMVFSRDKALTCLADNAAKVSSGCSAALKTASCNAKAPANIKEAFPCTE